MHTDNDIRREFQSKFGEMKAPVPADGWYRVEQSLQVAAAARMTVRRRWYAASAAAVLIMLIGSILFYQGPVDKTEPMITEYTSPGTATEASPEKRTETVKPDETTTLLMAQSKKKVTHVSAGTEIQQDETVISSPDASAMIRAWLRRTRANVGTVKKELQADNLQATAASAGRVNDGDKQHEEVFITVGNEREGLYADNGSRRSEDERIVLALNGRGGLTSFQQTVNSPMTLRSASLSGSNHFAGEPAKMALTSNNTADNISEMEHDQPVSFGITVSRQLFDDLALETGLVYTYLSSKARNTNSNFQVSETQHLHYLGIPLNLNYNLFSLKKLDIYASIGGMIEKDLYGEFRKVGEGQTLEFNSSSEEEEVTKISQRNPQLSVNAGVGVSYPLYNSLKLYGKIGGAYYFDANNPYKTIYSDSKIVMGLNVGLRYEF